MTDIHSHILPLVDDGSERIEESLSMLKEEEAQGVKSVILTPHYRASFNKEKSELEKIFGEFKKVAKNNGINIDLYLGQEIYWTEKTLSLLKEDRLLTLNNTKYVLAEFSTVRYSDVTEAAYELVANGYIPVIAHVERYDYVDLSEIEEIRSLGGLIQVNASSVMGKPKRKYRKKVKKLMKAGLVDFVASDIHYVRTNRMKKAYEYVSKKFGKETAEKIFKLNAQKLLG